MCIVTYHKYYLTLIHPHTHAHAAVNRTRSMPSVSAEVRLEWHKDESCSAIEWVPGNPQTLIAGFTRWMRVMDLRATEVSLFFFLFDVHA